MKCTKLIYESPIFGSACSDNLFEEHDGRIEFGPEGVYMLYSKDYSFDNFIARNIEELGEYVPQELKNLVVKATFGKYEIHDRKLYFATEIYVKQNPDLDQCTQITNWITGQMSDGWGESVEQEHVLREQIRYTMPYFDTENLEIEEEEMCDHVEYYIHPWNSTDFYVELVNSEVVELDIPCEKPVVHSATCKLQEGGEYMTRTVYKFDDVENVVECIVNSKACYEEGFINWIKEHGTFGCATCFYFVCVNQGMLTKILPMLGVMDMDTDTAKIYTINAENGLLNTDGYTGTQYGTFYADLLNN